MSGDLVKVFAHCVASVLICAFAVNIFPVMLCGRFYFIVDDIFYRL